MHHDLRIIIYIGGESYCYATKLCRRWVWWDTGLMQLQRILYRLYLRVH